MAFQRLIFRARVYVKNQTVFMVKKKIISYTGIFQHSLVKYTKHTLCQLNIMPISAGWDW